MGDPASLLLAPIVDGVITDATSFIKQELRLLRGVEGDVEKLSSILTSIRAVLEDHREEMRLGSRQLKDWLGKLEEAAYDAEDILETYVTEASLGREEEVEQQQVGCFCTRASHKLEIAHKIKRLFARLDEIAKKKEQFHLNVNVNTGTSDDKYESNDVVVVVVGAEDLQSEVIDKLVSEESINISVIAVVGNGGMGKTTLALLVYNDAVVKSHFDFFMWVCVTDNFDYRRILQDMIKYHIEMKDDVNSLSDIELESRLVQILAGKCFLLVLDDVWTEDYKDWEKIQNISKNGGKGCRVLVTSRMTMDPAVVGALSTIRLDSMPLDYCWILFEITAFKNCNLTGFVRSELEMIGMEIVRKCNGVPLAVKVMGSLLHGNYDVKKWLDILKHRIWEAEDPNNVMSALKLSYDRLPSHLQQCFACCHKFPQDYEFSKIELIKLWKGASLIPFKGRYAYKIGRDYIDELVARSFFEPSLVDMEEKYKMHDLIHDLAQSVSSTHNHQVKDNKRCHIL